MLSYLDDENHPWRPQAQSVSLKFARSKHDPNENNLDDRSNQFAASLDVQGSEFTLDSSLPCLTLSSESAPSITVDSIDFSGAGTGQNLLQIHPDDPNILVAEPPIDPCPVFQCPFDFLNCRERFEAGSLQPWVKHSESHFILPGRRVEPPRRTECRFCDHVIYHNSGWQCWRSRMEHVHGHHVLGWRLAHARPDFALMRHMWAEGLIDQSTYRHLLAAPKDSAYNGSTVLTTTSVIDNSMPVSYLNERRRRNRRQ